MTSSENKASISIKILKESNRQLSGIMSNQCCDNKYASPKNKIIPSDPDRLFVFNWLFFEFEGG